MRRLPFLLVLLAAATSAQAPRTISYQGVLEDGGTPVTSATDLTFRLYATATGGTALWTETQTVTPDATGAFSVRLGTVTGLTGLDFDDPRWLSTEAGGTTLGPRTALDAAPYALGLYGVRVTPPANSTQGPQIAAGHPSNTAAGTGAVVSGGGTSGSPNQATGDYAAIGGGGDNLAGNNHATISGGQGNNATGSHATVGGGQSNSAGGGSATVGGGQSNSAGGGSATVGGGFENAANGELATVGGGRNNQASGFGGTIGGGRNNGASSTWTTVGGGFGNTANRDYATVGGGLDNTANDTYATIGGGRSNTAGEIYATVGGGQNNVASGIYSTVPGGSFSHARGTYSFASGFFARAVHDGAFVWSDNSLPGADSLVSTAQDQFLVRAAGGVGIGTNAPGAQVHVETNSTGSRPHLLLDETDATDFARLDFRNGNPSGNAWTIAGGATDMDRLNFFTRSRNVVQFFADADDGGTRANLIETSAGGASLTQGGVWTNASSRALKTDFLPVDPEAVLTSLMDIPVTRWRYRAEAGDVWHLGPMSQDFHAAFGLGASTESIGTVDADGVALAAAQALAARTEAQASEIAALRADRDRLGAEVEALRAQVAALAARLDALAASGPTGAR